MDKSKSTDIPKKTFTTEFLVGVFSILSLIAIGYLCINLGGMDIGSSRYPVFAEFDNIAGLKKGASVEIAGVQIGEVSNIELIDPQAKITLLIDKNVKIKDDDIALIRTKGIIGDRYVKISRGSSSIEVAASGTISETESVVDFEDIIGKIIHNIGKTE